MTTHLTGTQARVACCGKTYAQLSLTDDHTGDSKLVTCRPPDTSSHPCTADYPCGRNDLADLLGHDAKGHRLYSVLRQLNITDIGDLAYVMSTKEGRTRLANERTVGASRWQHLAQVTEHLTLPKTQALAQWLYTRYCEDKDILPWNTQDEDTKRFWVIEAHTLRHFLATLTPPQPASTEEESTA
jgi:hypothetical protein